MTIRVGKCPVCGGRFGLVWSSRVIVPRVVGIQQFVGAPKLVKVISSHWVIDWAEETDPCFGSGQLPAPDPKLDRQRYRRQRKKVELVDPFRVHAAVALDAWIEGRDYPDTGILLAVSLYNYRLHYPQDRAHSAVRYVAKRNKAGGNSNYGDVFCTFCGLLLRRSKVGRHAAFIGLSDRHAVECALKHLAFGLVPAQPDVRLLPAEYVVGSGDA